MAITKILLISPNLAPESCGVSDYCLVLAEYLSKLQYEVYMLALSDRYTNQIEETDNSLRIPFSTSVSIQKKFAHTFIIKTSPKYIFFNFVSYGYHSKGLPFYLIPFFTQIKIPLFIIFHELWIGNFDTEGVKKKILGSFQRKLVLYLIKRTNSAKRIVVSDIFKQLLFKNHISNISLPVFSNIPLCKKITNGTSTEVNQFIFFGSLAFKIDVQKFVAKIKEINETLNKPIQIVHVGIWQGYTENLLSAAEQLALEGISFHRAGQLSKNEISNYFSNSILGLTSYIPAFWGKSGSIAAMFMHGLPVLSVAEQDPLNNMFTDIVLPKRLFTLTTSTKTIIQTLHSSKQINQNYNDELLENMIKATIQYK